MLLEQFQGRQENLPVRVREGDRRGRARDRRGLVAALHARYGRGTPAAKAGTMSASVLTVKSRRVTATREVRVRRARSRAAVTDCFLASGQLVYTNRWPCWIHVCSDVPVRRTQARHKPSPADMAVPAVPSSEGPSSGSSPWRRTTTAPRGPTSSPSPAKSSPMTWPAWEQCRPSARGVSGTTRGTPRYSHSSSCSQDNCSSSGSMASMASRSRPRYATPSEE